MAKPRKNSIREQRIEDEIVVDAYGPEEKLAPEEACTDDMLVLIRWSDRKVAVPLSQLTAIKQSESTDQAIADWQYWVAQGYLF